MFDNIGFDEELNVTLFYTPDHMRDEYYDIVDRTIDWNTGLDVAYGYMFATDDRVFI
jgi:hypothetical protein